MAKEIQLLTHSRQASFKSCRKKSWFEYEQGIRRTTDAKALRMGTAHHAGLEVLHSGGDLDRAVEVVRDFYSHTPEHLDQTEWRYEAETCVRIICGYHWRWQDSGIKFLAAEMPFSFPLVNPATQGVSKAFALAGKIDGICELEDGRLAVLESKLLGDDIGPDSTLWRRLRIEHQITLYILAARQLGYAVDTVMYDVARKPTVQPTQIPLLDELGAKVVLDANGCRVRTEKGLFRQTGDTAKGYVLQQRPMSADEWGEKLNDDIASRPDFYFQRKEVPRLDQDIAEYQEELWDIALTLRDAQVKDRWYRTSSKNTCDFCSVFDLCCNNWKAGDSLPKGFIILSDKHPELKGTNNGHSPDTTSPTTAATEAAHDAAAATYW